MNKKLLLLIGIGILMIIPLVNGALYDNLIFNYYMYNASLENSTSPITASVTATTMFSTTCLFNTSGCYKNTGGDSGKDVNFGTTKDLSAVNNFGLTNLTIFWCGKVTSSSGLKAVMDSRYVSGGEDYSGMYHYYTATSNNLYVSFNWGNGNKIGDSLAGVNGANVTSPHCVMLIVNSTSKTISAYFNNSFKKYLSSSATGYSGTYNTNLYFGRQQDSASRDFNGEMELFMIWNKSLSTSERNTVWNNGKPHIIYKLAGGGGGDSTPPTFSGTVTKNDSSIQKNEHVNFSCKATDETSLNMIQLSNNQSGSWVNVTNSGILANPTTTYNYTTSAITITANKNTVVAYMCCANDTSNNEACSAKQTFVVQNTAPTLSITTPANNQAGSTNLSAIFTATDADSDTMSCTLYVNGSVSSVINASVVSGTSTTLRTINLYNDGHYNWNVSCSDGTASVTSSNYVFIEDHTLPTITFTYPSILNTSISKNPIMRLNVLVGDDRLDVTNVTAKCSSGTIIYTNTTTWTTQTSVTLQDYINFTSCSDGIHTIDVSARDRLTSSPELKELGVLTKGDNKISLDDKNKNEKPKDNDKSYIEDIGIIDLEYKDKDKKMYDVLFKTKDKQITDSKIRVTFDGKHFKEDIFILFNTQIEKDGIDIYLIGNIKYFEDDIKGHFTIDDLYYRHFNDISEPIHVIKIDGGYLVHIDYDLKISVLKDVDGKTYWILDPITGGLNKISKVVSYTLDLKTPKYSGINISGTLKKGNYATLKTNWTDNNALGGFILEHNMSGTKSNTTYNTTFVNNNISQVRLNLTQSKGKNIGWKFYCNDSVDNINYSMPTQTFTILNTQVPTPTSLNWKTAGGFTSGTRSYNQIIDFINATCTEDIDNDFNTCYITITDPDNIIIVDNVSMTNYSTNKYSYSTDFTLNKVGTWSISVSASDNSSISTASTTITVAIITPSIFDGYYAYDYNYLPTDNTITTDFNEYAYDSVGIRMNWSRFNTDFKTLYQTINASKNNHSVKSMVRLYFDGNYNPTTNSYTNTTCSQINENFTMFKLEPYTEAIVFFYLNLNQSQSFKTNFSNRIAECIINATANKFPVYVDYTNTSLDSNWVSTFDLTHFTSSSVSDYITQENQYIRNSTALTRIYHDLSTDIKTKAKDYHNKIITKIRGTITSPPSYNITLGQISNGDLIIYNNQSNSRLQIIRYNNSAVHGKDVWDYTNKTLIEQNTDGNFTVNMSSNSFSYILFDNIDHLTLTEVYSGITASNQRFGYNRTGESVATYAIVSTNQAMLYLYFPDLWRYNQFMQHYQYINSSWLTNYSDYSKIIISDKNSYNINNTIGRLDDTLGYTSVGDFNDSIEWFNAKKAEILIWLDIFYIGSFLDGLDTAVAESAFPNWFVQLVNFIQIDKQKEVITNDYTSYSIAGVGGLGNGDMKESWHGKWSGTVSSPTYYIENPELDKGRGLWAKTNGNTQYVVSFGKVSDTAKMMYSYAKFLVWMGTANNNSFTYRQPDFQSQQEIFTFDAGDMLENSFTEVNDTYHYRRYSNGKVWINPQDNSSWGFENGRTVNNLSICLKMQIYASDPEASAPVMINVNGHELDAITYDEVSLVQWGSNIVCRDITPYYNETGKYVVRIYSDAPATPTGMNIYNTESARTGVFSFYANALGVPQAENSTNWIAYTHTQTNGDWDTKNWYGYLIANYSDSAQIDDGITDISQTNITSDEGSFIYTNISIGAKKEYNITVWSNPVIVNSNFLNVSYTNKKVYPVNTTTCLSTDPVWNSTTINSEVHKSCYKDNLDGTISIRFAVPHLSNQTYTLTYDGNTPPVVTTVYPTSNTVYALQPLNLNYSVYDADGDAITQIKIYVNRTLNQTLTHINTTFNASDGVYSFNISAYDGVEWSNNVTISNVTIDTTAPTITINSPINNSYHNSTTVKFNVSLSEIGSWCGYSLDRASNVTMSKTGNYFNYTKQSLSQGEHNITFSCNDSYSNMRTSTYRYFTVDTISPAITLISPTNGTSKTTTLTNFTWNVSDTTLVNCTMKVSNTKLFNRTNLLSGQYSNKTTLSVGSYTWTVNCTDQLKHNSVKFNTLTITSPQDDADNSDSDDENPASPVYNDEEELPIDNLTFNPIIKPKIDQIKDDIKNTSNNIKQFVIDTAKEPSTLSNNWKELTFKDKAFMILGIILSISVISLLIYFTTHIVKKPKKPKPQTTEDWIGLNNV